MNLRTFITLHAILTLGLGIAFTLYGPLMMALYGIPDIPEENVVLYWNVASFARMFGAALFSTGLLIWAVRALFREAGISSEIRRGLLFSLLLASAITGFVALIQAWSIWLGWAGWLITAVFVLLFLGYVVFLYIRPESWEQAGSG